MLSESRPLVVYVSLAAALALVWSFRLFVLDIPSAVTTLLDEARIDRYTDAEFLSAAAAVEFPAPIDYAPLRAACARTTFRPGLLFSCEGQHGGVGMVRDQILKCVRYAIHGGGAVVVPSMALRNASDLSDIEGPTEVPFENMLDRDTFKTHLTEGCPGMRIYDRKEDFPNYTQRQGSPLDLVGDQFEPDHPREGLRHPREWRRFFDDWLRQKGVSPREEAPVHVQMQQAFLEYPVADDGPAFVHEFGKILSFRNDTRELAAKVLLALRRRFALPIDPTRAISPNAFYAAHLRLEEDAIAAWPPAEWRFSRMEDQFDAQFRNLEKTGLEVVYVTSGNQTVVELFEEDLRRRRKAYSSGGKGKNVTVVTKQDLLTGEDRRRLDGLTFDQQALVDFLVLFRSSAFMGVAHSSFPWTIALRRHEMSRYKGYANEGSDIFKDEFSTIMGMRRDYPDVEPFVYGLWP